MSLDCLGLFSGWIGLRTVCTCAVLLPSVARALNCVSYHIFRSFDSHKEDYWHSKTVTDETRSLGTFDSKKTFGSFIKYFMPISLPQSISEMSFWSGSGKPLNLDPSNISESASPWELNFSNIRHNRESITDPFNADLEKLVKVVINFPLRKGEIITMRSKEHEKIQYQVHSKISAKGLVSYALKPLDEKIASPLIVFRGTEPNPLGEESFNSLRNDIEKNLGKTGWICSKSSFETLMNDPSFRSEDQKIEVAGYSLGGAHAQYFIAEHHENVSKGTFYSNPNIDSYTVEKFADEIQNSHRSSLLSLQIFRVLGDPVPHFGVKHLGCGISHPNLHTQLIEIDIPHQMAFDVNLHWKKVFHTQTFDYIAREYTDPDVLEKKLNNHIRDPISSFLEGLRGKLSNALHFLVDAFEYSFYRVCSFLKKKFQSHNY